MPQYFVCDSDRDCEDGSDEASCQDRACPPNYFRCANGQCIPQSWVCDGHPDCQDQLDERQSCQPPVCDAREQFACSSYVFNTTYCIPKHWRCDRVRDCADGSDESAAKCTYRQCQSDDFRCGAAQRRDSDVTASSKRERKNYVFLEDRFSLDLMKNDTHPVWYRTIRFCNR